MPTLIPVDDDPFAPKAGGPQLVPVDHDPFAKGVGAIDFSAPDDQVRAAIGKLPEKERAAALNQWGDAYVARERAGQSDIGKAVGDQFRNVARGVPILGSYLDEANAGFNSAMSPDIKYDEALAYQHAKDRATDKDSGWAGTAAKVTGGLGGLASLPYGLAMRLIGGTSGPLAARIMAGGAAGAVTGGIQGFGDGEGGLENRGHEMLKGAGVGGAFGAAAPVIGSALGTARTYLADRLQGIPQALQGYARGAVDNIASAVGSDRQAGTLRDVRKLGPEGMVLDAGPETLAHAEAIASRPGPGRPEIIGAVTQRGQGAAGRITDDVNTALGPQRDTPTMLLGMKKQRSLDANALYGEVRNDPNAEAIWGPALQDLTSRPSVKRAIDTVGEIAAEQGNKVTNPFIKGPNGELTLPEGVKPNFKFWDHVKQGIDAQINADPRNGNLIATKNELLKILDEMLPSYAGARQRYSTQSAVMDAVEEGKTAFKKGTDPNEMKLTLNGMSEPERLGYKLGGRQNVANIMGEAADPESEARRAFRSPYARQRLGLVAGEEGATRLANRLDTEGVFQEAENGIRGGSPTARRQAFKELYPAPGAERGKIGNLDTTGVGLLVEGVKRAAGAITGGMSDAAHGRIASDAAAILTTPGPQRDALISALLQRNGAITRRSQGNADIDRLVQILIGSSRPAAVDGLRP